VLRFEIPSKTLVVPQTGEPHRYLPTRPLSILIVDDNQDNRTVLKAYFRSTIHRVDCAVTGLEGVDKIKNGQYDLVLMDMEMPVMDGYTAVRNVREWERETGRTPLPVIALTANALKEDRQRSLNAGCTAHLTKPINKSHLLEAVEKYAE
jgi:CheY-like chemotaxis protein